MGTAGNDPQVMQFPPIDQKRARKNYANPNDLRHTFEALSNLHKLLPNHRMETLHSYKSDEDRKKCETADLSGLERILERHHFPPEINLTPKPSRMLSWKSKAVNTASEWQKKCPLWKRNSKEPPMHTVVVRWLKKNLHPTEDLKSVMDLLSAFGPIQSVTACGRQSAIVVFSDINSACKAVSAFHSKVPGSTLQCSWQQRFMAKDVRFSITKRLCEFF
ncbi:uncharacterized protein C6orf201 homolog [Fukomys damarensis]|uniref:uncharacterized protein C6orf201 homolog n=1 Tax=Fukomys damarensis TaxID=885580 RepID=UPI00053F7D03|nr:uncharacterized protein C6orf201 homolog [Fukomys damarensis]